MINFIQPIYGFRRNQGFSASYSARANCANSLSDIDPTRPSDGDMDRRVNRAT